MFLKLKLVYSPAHFVNLPNKKIKDLLKIYLHIPSNVIFNMDIRPTSLSQ